MTYFVVKVGALYLKPNGDYTDDLSQAQTYSDSEWAQKQVEIRGRGRVVKVKQSCRANQAWMRKGDYSV